MLETLWHIDAGCDQRTYVTCCRKYQSGTSASRQTASRLLTYTHQQSQWTLIHNGCPLYTILRNSVPLPMILSAI